jgi:hypothetical protein
MEALLEQIEVAVSARNDMKPQWTNHVGSELRYSKFGWTAHCKVLAPRKRRGTEIFGSPCSTPEAAVQSLIESLDFWGPSIAK